MKRFFIGFGLLLLMGGNSFATECIRWQEVYAKQAARHIPPHNWILVVAPWRNDTGLKADDWLSYGLAHLLKRYLASPAGVTVLFEKEAGHLPPPRSAEYKMEGMFQHRPNWLRVFVTLKDKNNQIAAQIPMETPFPLHKRFFDGMREAAEKILKQVKLKNTAPEIMKQIANETNNVHAFENYVKGKMALETFDRNKIEVALIWFQEARREDFKYAQALAGLAETYGFLILYHKQKGEDFQKYLEAMENIDRERKRWERNAPENRYLKAHVHYVTGERALTKNETEKAAAEFKQALELVPEDARTAYALAQSYAKLGKTELAGQYRNEAEGINPCLKK